MVEVAIPVLIPSGVHVLDQSPSWTTAKQSRREAAVPILHSRNIAAAVPWVSDRRVGAWRRDGSRGRSE